MQAVPSLQAIRLPAKAPAQAAGLGSISRVRIATTRREGFGGGWWMRNLRHERERHQNMAKFPRREGAMPYPLFFRKWNGTSRHSPIGLGCTEMLLCGRFSAQSVRLSDIGSRLGRAAEHRPAGAAAGTAADGPDAAPRPCACTRSCSSARKRRAGRPWRKDARGKAGSRARLRTAMMTARMPSIPSERASAQPMKARQRSARSRWPPGNCRSKMSRRRLLLDNSGEVSPRRAANRGCR